MQSVLAGLALAHAASGPQGLQGGLGSRIDAAMLQRRLEEQELELLRELRAIEAGLEQAGEPAGLKAWLNRNAG